MLRVGDLVEILPSVLESSCLSKGTLREIVGMVVEVTAFDGRHPFLYFEKYKREWWIPEEHLEIVEDITFDANANIMDLYGE